MTAFGYLLPTREVVMAQAAPDFGAVLALAEHAEALGFDSVWVGDSVLARPRLEAFTTLAAVAARTRRVRLGTAILLLALRQPVVLANELANLDIVSGGRLTLGLGVGSKTDTVAREFEACGVPMAQRVGRFEETIDLLRALWTQPEVTYEGRYFQLRGVKLGLKPAQRPGPPLWLAGHVDPAYRRVLRQADGWLPNPPSPASFTAGLARLDELGREMQRDARTLHRGVYTTLNINPDAVQADREIRTFLEGYYGAPYASQSRRHSHCAGSAETCAAWLQAFIDAGAQSFVLRFGGSDQRAQLDRFANTVLPRVRR
jgi:probable F420-dependent oxidoreductase